MVDPGTRANPDLSDIQCVGLRRGGARLATGGSQIALGGRDLNGGVEARLTAGESEDVDRFVRNHRGAVRERVESAPSIAYPDSARRNIVRCSCTGMHLAALIVDADRVAVLHAALERVVRRDPQRGLGIRSSERRQRAAVIIEAVELRQRASLAEPERLPRRRQIFVHR